MAILKEANGARWVALSPRCLVGRARRCDLVLSQDAVSGEHASVYFQRGEWKVRDLGSSNGTFLNGTLLARGATAPLLQGDELSFGLMEEGWSLDDASPPAPSARRGDGHRVVGEPKSLWLPSAEAPRASVVWEKGKWFVEDDGGSREARSAEVLQLDTESWTLELPDFVLEGGQYTGSTVSIGPELELQFRVAADQEHVALSAVYDGGTTELGARSHNYCLLVLARERLEAAERGEEPEEQGWIYVDVLEDRLKLDRKALNLLLWRAKQTFEKAGVPAELLLERRLTSGQIRIGVSRCTIAGA